MILMMYGYPATGKTCTVSMIGQFFKERNCAVKIFSTLEVRRRYNLFDLASEEHRNLVYDILISNIAGLLSNNVFDVILIDGNFNKRNRRNRLYSALSGEHVWVIKCVVSDESDIDARLDHRKKYIHLLENKAATKDLYNLIKNTGEIIEEDEQIISSQMGLIEYDTSKTEAKIVIDSETEEQRISEVLYILNNGRSESYDQISNF